jgi:hypothetical protein
VASINIINGLRLPIEAKGEAGVYRRLACQSLRKERRTDGRRISSSDGLAGMRFAEGSLIGFALPGGAGKK